MKSRFLPFVILLAASLFALFAAESGDASPANTVVEVKLVDGSTVRGLITDRTTTELTMRTSLGVLRIPAAQLTAASKKEFISGTMGSAEYEAEIQALEARVAALEAENQELRKRLVASSKAAPRAPSTPARHLVPSTPDPSPRLTPSKEEGGLSYTISSTGKRHNSRCRYYGSGSPCGPTAGVACKICRG